MAGTIICPDCGRVAEYGRRKRERCPECALKRMRKMNRERSMEDFKAAHLLKNTPEKEEPDELAKERMKHDAEIDARSRKQIQLQCRFCKYQLRQGSNCQSRCIGCDYISWKGHSTDKGNGVGDCRSFEPMTKETQAERTARRRKAITISEADKAQNTGEKMRDVNQL